MGKYVSAGTGTAKGDDSYKVGKDAVKNSIKNLKENGGERPDFGFVFASSKFDLEELAKGIDEVMKENGTEWVGVTTAGEITDMGPGHDSCAVLTIDSDRMHFYVGKSMGMWDDPVDTGIEAMKNASRGKFRDADNDKKFIIPLMAGMTVDPLRDPSSNFEVVRGIYKELSNDVACAGGAAGDKFHFHLTHQFHNGEIYEDAVIVVAVATDLKFNTGEAHGCLVEGSEGTTSMTVDEVKGDNVLSKLDGEKALTRYSELLGIDEDELREAFELPTGVKLQKIAKHGGVMNPLGMEIGAPQPALKLPVSATEDGDIVFHDKLVEGMSLKFMKVSNEENINAVRKALETDLSGRDAFSLMFNCAYRWIALGDKTDEEIKAAREYLDGPFAGFYTYGEVGYPVKGMPSYFGYTTTTLTVFDEISS